AASARKKDRFRLEHVRPDRWDGDEVARPGRYSAATATRVPVTSAEAGRASSRGNNRRDIAQWKASSPHNPERDLQRHAPATSMFHRCAGSHDGPRGFAD